jgi:N-carbamoyl-D-amino-acid hydrolase
MTPRMPTPNTRARPFGRMRVAAAQLGPNQEEMPRASVVKRLVALTDQAASEQVDLVVFPELALTTYFPKRIRDDADQFFDTEMPNPSVQPLFDRAREAGMAFCLGYAERTEDGRHFNTMIYVDASGAVARRYRKLHLPGLPGPAPAGQFRVYEPYFFDHGDTGLHPFATQDTVLGMMLCQDRRYPETYRALGLEGAEVIVSGYNTPAHPLSLSQHELCLRAGAYENSLFVIATAKAGVEDGAHLIGGSCVVDPNGQVIARADTEDDELVTAELDLTLITEARNRWDFYGRRHPGHYTALTADLPEHRS